MQTQSLKSETSLTQFGCKHRRIWKTQLRDTGYAAAALAVGSAVAGSRKRLKLHKNLAYLSGLFTLWHIGIVEYYKHLKTK